MPFMQAIGMEKDELVQALGVFFTVATVALAFNLTAAGLLTAATALPGAVAMAASFAGMFIGQAVRTRMQPEVFRRWFLIAMIFLGLYLAGSALVKHPRLKEAEAVRSARLQHRDADAEIDEQPAEQRG